MIHRRSKISRLPEAAITPINESLDANVEYARILDGLREQGKNSKPPHKPHITAHEYDRR
jgi:hypothetical protein